MLEFEEKCIRCGRVAHELLWQYMDERYGLWQSVDLEDDNEDGQNISRRLESQQIHAALQTYGATKLIFSPKKGVVAVNLQERLAAICQIHHQK